MAGNGRLNKVVYGYFDGNECFYIGIGNSNRPYRIFKSVRSDFCFNKINKSEDFHIQILHSGLTSEMACWYEKSYIKSIGRRDLNKGTLTNHTDGGESTKGYIFTEEDKLKISKACKGKNKPEDFGQKISRALKGRKFTEKTKQKMSDSAKLKIATLKKSNKKLPASEARSQKIHTPKGIFNSLREAEKHFDISRYTISHRCKNNKYLDYYFL